MTSPTFWRYVVYVSISFSYRSNMNCNEVGLYQFRRQVVRFFLHYEFRNETGSIVVCSASPNRTTIEPPSGGKTIGSQFIILPSLVQANDAISRWLASGFILKNNQPVPILCPTIDFLALSLLGISAVYFISFSSHCGEARTITSGIAEEKIFLPGKRGSELSA